VHGIVYIPIEHGDSDPLEKEVRTLGELLQQVKDEQEYIKVRERVHRNSTFRTKPPLTNSRRKHQFKSQVVEYIPDGSIDWRMCLSSCISQTVLWLVILTYPVGSSR
jgi:hypothetical protein